MQERIPDLTVHRPTDIWILRPDEKTPEEAAVETVGKVLVAFRPRRNEDEKPEYVQ